VHHFKARLGVVRGDFQVEGEDYDEKYAPVVPWSTVRLLLSITASQGLATRQVDFFQTRLFQPVSTNQNRFTSNHRQDSIQILATKLF
jgi:hypothetical protein